MSFEAIASILTLAILAAPAVAFYVGYSAQTHRAALGKAFFLWAVSSSPVVCGILLSKPPNPEADLQAQLQVEFIASFSISEMFVYSAAFISPVLYVVFDLIKGLRDGDLKPNLEEVARYMRGMQWVFLSAIGILILTLLAYASAKSNPVEFSKTYLFLIFTGKGYIVYISSILIWYSVVLWESEPQKFSFETSTKSEASSFANDFAKRKGHSV